MRSRRNDFDFTEYLSLGREVAEKRPDFKLLAPLGHSYARKRAVLEFWQWKKKNPKASGAEKIIKLVDLVGEAEMLEEIKEIGRLCLILGDTRPIKDWNDE